MTIPSRGLQRSIHGIGIGQRRIQLASRGFSTTPVSTTPRRVSQKTSQLSRRPNPLTQRPTLYSIPSARFKSTLPPIASPTTDAVHSVTTDIVPPDPLIPSSLDAATEISAIPEHIGYLKELGLDFGWGPTAFVEWLLEHIHVWSGTPWWASIVIAAVTVRVALLKPYIGAADTSARLASIKHLATPITEKMTASSRAGDRSGAMMARAELKALYAKSGIKTYKAFVPLVQVFLGYGSFRLMRAMANLPVPGLENGGVAWFPDLTTTDPFYIMPLATGAMFLLVMKKGGELGTSNLSPTVQKFLTYGFPTMTVVFMSGWPATLQLSFFVSSIISYLQATAFRNPAFRRWAGIAPLPPKPASSGAATPTISTKLNIAPSYQPPSARSIPPSAAPAKKPKGVIGGAVAEIQGMVTEARKSIDQFAGTAARKPGLSSPVDLKQAKASEEKRKRLLSAQRYAEEEERRERRRAKVASLQGRNKR
ncbi:MAG: Mitochondrial inner membrane protein oxa1 [Trichoglossum hirsutum]|nr:MAG: Mitochondrial inner membrane protein oxa1 [Trichoglossum hirsutum]